MGYWEVVRQAYTSYANYLWDEISHPGWHNYFYWLIGISLFAMLLEWIVPWRKQQARIREDFWLDVFYMFFNFFLFSLIVYNALSDVFVKFFHDILANAGIRNLVAIEIAHWPHWAQLVLMFVLRDFIQWNIHRLLHRVPFLWEFHKVHHSVQQMGFAAHLRYHFMETLVYRSLEYVPLAMIGFGLKDFFIVHISALAIGHLNHSNIYLPLGPLKYLFNSPQMHIWHHAERIPSKLSGVNFGLSLSLWDYLFGTVYMPHDGRDEKLGFSKIERYPHTFFRQVIAPFQSLLRRQC